MSLVAYTITALERDVADATASGKQVIVGATCSMYSQPSDTVVTLYDDAAGSNGSTAKVTSENGQVVVYVEPGEYRLSVNGIDSFITIGGSAKITTSDLIALDNASSIGDVIDTTGYSVAGDGGGGQWVKTGETGSASQSPIQLNDALLNDAKGNQWRLVYKSELAIEQLGGNDALRAAINSRAPVITWAIDRLTLDASTYIVYSGQHIKGQGQDKSTIVVNPGLPYDDSVFRNEAPNNSSDGVRYDKNIRFSDFTIDCSDRNFPIWLTSSNGDAITDPESDYLPGGIIGDGGDIFDVVAADRRNADYSLNSSVFAMIKVERPIIERVTFINQNSFGVSDLGCLSMRVRNCTFNNHGKIDNISSGVWTQSNGNPKSPDVSFQDSEDHITEHCLFDCNRSAITLSSSKGGKFRFNKIERTGESAVYVGSNGNYNGGEIEIHNNEFGENTITDIVSNQVELSKNDRVYIYNNTFYESNGKSIGVPGCKSVEIFNNRFINQVARTVSTYPYGPFSERYGFNVGGTPVAGDALSSYSIIMLSNQDSIGSDSIDIYNNHFENDGVTTYEDSIIGLTKATGSNLMKNIRFRGNDASLLDSSLTLYSASANVLNTEYSIDTYDNTGTDTARAIIIKQSIASGTTGAQYQQIGFRPRIVKVSALDESGLSFWQGELTYIDGGDSEPSGFAVNIAGSMVNLNDEFYRTIDGAGSTVNKAEFISYKEDGFQYNVISSASDIELTFICSP
jgi:hypothetical protein